MKRPLIWCCLSFMAGITCTTHAAKQLLFCGILFALFSLCLFVLKKSPWFFLIVLFFLLGSCSLRHWQTTNLEQTLPFHETELSFVGTINQIPQEGKNGMRSYTLSLSSINGKNCSWKLWLNTKERFSLGETIQGTGEVESTLALQRSGDGFGDYLVSRGYSLSCTTSNLSTLPSSVWNTLRFWPMKLREQMISLLNQHLSAPWRGILVAVSTGDRSDLTSVQKDIFTKTGTSHIISVSGLHVAILLLMLLALFELLRIPYPMSRFLCLPIPFFLLLFYGTDAPVLRACMMGFLFLLAECVWADYDPMNSLFFSAFVILILWPNQLFEASFLLSFSSTFGILAFAPVLSKAGEKWISSKEVRFLLATSLSSYITSLLVVLIFFHQLPAISLVANLLLIPLFPILLIGTCLLGIVSAAAPILAPVLGKLLELLTMLMFEPLTWMSKSPTISLATPNQFIIGGTCFFLAFLYFLSRRQKNLLLFLCFTVCFGAGLVSQYRLSQYDSLTLIDAGGIENVLLQTEKGKSLLLVGADEDSSSFSYDYREFEQHFRKINLKTIDLFCFMNYNKNTVALFHLLGQDRTISAVLLPPDAELFKEIKRIAEKNDTKTIGFSQPLMIPLSGNSHCNITPNGDVTWVQNQRLVAQMSDQPSQTSLLSIQRRGQSVLMNGQAYTKKNHGTLQFFLEQYKLKKIIADYPE